jgi:AcrR family transcriptional regulator
MTLADTLMARRKNDARAEIARTAIELFARDGFETTSVEAIAAAAGCSPRTFYRYFGSKEEVMFHDLPDVMEQLGEVIERHLSGGLGPWSAVSASVIEFIRRFDDDEQWVARQRLHLWLDEPALRARYMQYVTRTEHVIADCLGRHGGATSEDADRAQLIAVAATGAYRAAIFTPPPREGETLEKHLREALDALGHGLADSPQR